VKAHCRAYDTVHRVYQENRWAKVYGKLISSLKSGDRDLMVRAFSSDEW